MECHPRSLPPSTASRMPLAAPELWEAEKSSFHEDSTDVPAPRLARWAFIPASFCAGKEPAWAMIGWLFLATGHCQQIHAIADMLDAPCSTADDTDGAFAESFFVPGVPLYLHFPGPKPKQESCRRALASEIPQASLIGDPPSIISGTASQRLLRPRLDPLIAPRNINTAHNSPNLIVCTGISKLESSGSQPVRTQMER